MERYSDIDQSVCDAARARLLAESLAGDSDLTDRIDANGFPTQDPSGILYDRSDRTVISYYPAPDGSFQPTRLKLWDDVDIGGIPVRIIGAGRSHEMAAGICPWFGDMILMFEAIPSVRDRAPFDPQETPAMPISPEAQPPEVPQP